MADVKWIKITTDIFDDEKILLIESLPDSYAIITVWFKLLCLAGKQNNSGVFMMNNQIAYTDKMLATIFRMKETTVTMAIQTFEQFGMVEIIDGVITIPNWGKHQSLEQIAARKEYQKEYQREYRKKQKLLASREEEKESKHLRKHLREQNVNTPEEDKEKEERNKNIDNKEIHKEKNNYQQIIDLYNSICVSFPSARSLSDARKKAIKARLNVYTVDDFEQVFKNAEQSSFLKGGNNSNWTATFDWLIKDSNFAKVLDGNYTDNNSKPLQNNNTYDDLTALTYRRTGIRRVEPQMATKSEPPKTAADDETIRQRMEELRKQLK